MSEENKENRISVDDLPQVEKELTAEEAKDVAGGYEVKLEDAKITSYSIGAGGEGLAPTDNPNLKTK